MAISRTKEPYTFICPQCGIEFSRKNKGNNKKRFCSSKCARFNQIPDESKKKEYTCKFCNKKFTDWVYRNTTFCSRLCMSKYGARQPKPKARRPESFITRKCNICGKEYTIHKIFIEKRNSRFCSIECKGKQKSIDMMGNKNPNYVLPHLKLKPIKYGGKSWKIQSQKARDRDNNTCQRCGEVWNKEKHDKNFHVHHIVSIRKFDNYIKANKLENLITLCPSCHSKEHHQN